MGIIDGYLNRLIASRVVENDIIERAKHSPSGKLSASILGDPLQWQILKVFGAQPVALDEYTLRKFQRGHDVEERVMDWFSSCVLARQEYCEYRGVVGYLDARVTTEGWDFERGIVPLEVKSVTNAKFKRIVAQGRPDRGHALQNALYAISKGCEWFAVCYVASDDYRLQVYMCETKDYKDEVDRIIDRFDAQVMTGKIPVFVAEETWQGNKKYNRYPEWSGLTEEQIEEKLNGLIKAKIV